MGAVKMGGWFVREGGGGEIHSPKHHSGSAGVDAFGGRDAVYLGLVEGEVGERLG